MRRARHISVVIPVRNEAPALAELLPRIPAWVDQVVVVDNGSTDGSDPVARSLGATVLREERVGYGAACAAGTALVLAGGADVVVFLDGDGSDDPREMARLVDPILEGRAGLAVGCRDTLLMPTHQRLGTRFVCRLLEIGFGTGVRDLGPFRAVDAGVLSSLPLLDRAFGWTAEMQAEALRFGVPIVEVDVSWRPGQGDSEITGTWRGVARAARDLIRHSLREVLVFRIGRLANWLRLREKTGTEVEDGGRSHAANVPTLAADAAVDGDANTQPTNAFVRIARALFAPVPTSARDALRQAWARVPEAYRTPNQFLGRQYAGCGGLIGAMPRCDFACKGCYLGSDANRMPPLSLEAIDDQLRQIRAWLGEGGNLQLTDGELTLRDPTELVEIVRRAKMLGLVPMLMTHGDVLLRDPALLVRLVREGGLSEISIHIDTTQRGRRDRRYRHRRSELDLDPLRAEFAELIRNVRTQTGCTLEAATTVTVTRENLMGVGGIVRCLLDHSDAFKMVSFQPVARVGRTLDEVADHVEVGELWEEIEKGLANTWHASEPPSSHQGWLGHPDCSHFVQGLVFKDKTGATRFEPLLDPDDPRETECVQVFLDRLGGLTFRLDTRAQVAARLLGLLLRHPRFILTRLLPQIVRSARRFAPSGRVRTLKEILFGNLRVHYFNLVSHHFMSAAEIATDHGQERLDLCAFKVPIDGSLRSMCEVNALGLRDEFYARIPRIESRSREAEKVF